MLLVCGVPLLRNEGCVGTISRFKAWVYNYILLVRCSLKGGLNSEILLVVLVLLDLGQIT